MNAATDQDLVTIPRADALQIYTTPGAIKPYLDRVRTEVEAFQGLGQTVATAKGRQAIKSFAFRLARTRTALEGVGKALADKVKAIPKKVDATRKQVRDTLEAWEDDVRAPLTAWEEAEKARVAGHEAALAEIERWPMCPGEGWTAAQVGAFIDAKKTSPYQTRDWQEFAEKARNSLATSMNTLDRLLAAAEKRDAEAAELARLRAAEAERQAREREEQAKREAEAERQRIAEQAAAAERAKADQERLAAERARQEAEERASRAEREKAEAEERARLAAEQAERDRIAAEQAAAERERRAAEVERQRAAAEKEREAREAAAREADKKHRAAVNNAAVDALAACGVERDTAVLAVTLIARRLIPQVTISY